MDAFCGSNFWDSETVWNTDDPDLTVCFEKTVLVWVPCAFLWIFLPFEIHLIRRSESFDIPWNTYNVTKLVAIAILAAVSFTDIFINVFLSSSYFPVDLYSPLIKFVTFILFFGLTYVNVKFGRRSSAVLFLFSLLLLLCGVFQCRTEIRSRWTQEVNFGTVELICHGIYYSSILVVFLLNCCADSSPRITSRPRDKNACPRSRSSFLSRMLFTWFEPLAWKGYKKSLKNEDLWTLDYSVSSSNIVSKFEKHLNKSSENVRSYVFLSANLMRLAVEVFMFVNPQILSCLINFIGSDEPMWKGYTYVVLLFLAGELQVVLTSQHLNIMNTIALQIRACLISTIYKKALRMSNCARRDFTVGETVNLLTVDANRFTDLLPFAYLFFSTPVQIVLSVYFLWQILGPSTLAGVAVTILSVFVNSYLVSKIKSLQVKQMQKKDERIKLMNQILSGIKTLKLYAWEPSFEKKVQSIRNEEMKIQKKLAFLMGFTSFVWSSASFFAYSVSFAVYVLLSDKNVLTAEVAFVSLALFNIMKFPLLRAPSAISNLVQTVVSIDRLNKFLNSEDLRLDDVTHERRCRFPTEALVIENGSFSWDGPKASAILRDINVKIYPGALVAVVGPVGSGKSSLISAFLGEMYKLSGVVNTTGSIAYVPQQAWIQNATLRDNVTFGEPVRSSYYNEVLEACALKPDLQILPAGDLTEIGEKGINLSGGQKQRVSLARAAYCEADVYLLDDPLSAVDSRVSKHIFQKLIGPGGMLKTKTRVLVTHSVAYLSQVDLIVVMKDGLISESGTLEELMGNKGDFSEFLINYLKENADSNEENFEELMNVLDEKKLTTEKFVRHGSTKSESRSVASLNRQPSIRDEKRISAKKCDTFEKVPAGKKLIEEESVETGAINWGVFVCFMRSAGFFVTFLMMISNILLQALSVASNIWLSEWTDDPNATTPEGTQNIDERNHYLSIFTVLGLSKCVTQFMTSILVRTACWNTAKVLHKLMLKNLFRLPASFLDVTPSGRILSRFSKDIEVVDNSLPDQIAGFFFGFGDVIISLIFVASITPMFAFAVVPIAVIYYLIQRFHAASSRQLRRLESVSRSPIYSHFVETVVGLQSVRAYGLSEKFIQQSKEKVDLNHQSYYLNMVSNDWFSLRSGTISNVIIMLAALFAVLDRETINPGGAGLSIGYTLMLAFTLSYTACQSSCIETNIVAIERIKEYCETQQEAAWVIPNENVPPTWPSKGEINFQHFQVRYREGLQLVLKGITFSVNGGQKVGIVGRTGAGKSSLTLSLFRILESAGGRILIDGEDIAGLGLHTLRSRLTILPQDPIVFAGSLRMNLDPVEVHSDDDIWRALELAHLKPYILSLDGGLGYEITEGGENFSGGQKQLICLARALLRKTKILILDEATAAVDLETDDLIQSTIRKEFSDCTILTIAHRLNTVMDYDKIIVLDKGLVVEYNSPKILLETKTSIFYKMAADAGLV